VAELIVNQSVCSSEPSYAQSSQHASVCEIVTKQVIQQLESGVAPWRKPWRTPPPQT
jgi:antirestriction protein ArdC